MDLIIAIKEDRAFICKPPVKKDCEEIIMRLEEAEAENAETVFSFIRGDVVIDDNDNLHKVIDIHAPFDAESPYSWGYKDENGAVHRISELKGVLIKEVPKYYIDGLLS